MAHQDTGGVYEGGVRNPNMKSNTKKWFAYLVPAAD